MALFRKKIRSDEDYFLASQWTLMGRKLVRHKLARLSLWLLGLMYLTALLAGFIPMGQDIISAYKVGGASAALGHVSLCTTGYDPADGKWKPMFAAQKLYGPLLLGAVVHKVANRLGINGALQRAGVPLLRI